MFLLQFTDKLDYAIEKFIPINDKNKSTSKDWVIQKGALILEHVSEIMADTCNVSTHQKNK